MSKLSNRAASFILAATVALGTVMTPISAQAVAPTAGSGFTSEMGEQDWCQRMFETSGLRNSGCRVVAFSKMLSEAGIPVESPQAYWDWCYNNKVSGYFNSNGYETGNFGASLNPYAQSQGGSVQFITKESITNKPTEEINSLIMNYINQGYYCILSYSGHTAYVSRNDSINAGEAVVHESTYSTANPSEWTGTYNNIVKFQSSKYKNRTKYTGLRVYSITAPNREINGIYEGQYYITSAVNDNYAIDVYGAGASSGDNVNLWECNYSAAQTWNFKIAGDGYFYLEPACAPGYCLDVNGAGTANYTNIQIWASNGSAAQKWKFVDAGDGYYYMMPQCANDASVLDLKGAKATSGRNIQLYQKNDTKAQKWRITKIN